MCVRACASGFVCWLIKTLMQADIQCTRLNLTLLDWECRVFDFGHVISYVVDNYDGIRTLVRNGRFLRNLGLPIPERLVTTWQARKDYRPINAELEVHLSMSMGFCFQFTACSCRVVLTVVYLHVLIWKLARKVLVVCMLT